MNLQHSRGANEDLAEHHDFIRKFSNNNISSSKRFQQGGPDDDEMSLDR